MKKILSIMLAAVMLVSAICVNVSADGYYLQERFSNGSSSFHKNFIAGSTSVTRDGKLVGHSDARSIMSSYDDSSGVFNNTRAWLEYDAEIEICATDDRAVGGSREISLVYCNDNLVVAGIEEDRSFISFGYDFVKGEFYLTNCLGGGGEENQLVVRVAKKIDEDNFNQLGMTVTSGRIRGYFNGELIIDFVDTADSYRIAKKISSPFLFWNTGNYFRISAIDIASPEYIYPAGQTPVTNTTAAVTVAAVAHDLIVGDTQLVVDFVLNVPTGVTLSGFAVNFQYDREVMALVEASDYNIRGQGIYGQHYTDMPYNLVWAGTDRDAIIGTGKDLVVLSLTFELEAPATGGTEYNVNIACTDLKDFYSNSLEDSVIIKNAYVVATAKYTDAAVTVAAVAHDVTVGDTQLVVDFVLNVPTGISIQGFAVYFRFDAFLMKLVEASDYNIKGQGIYGQHYTDMPYNLVWAGIDRDLIKGTGEDIVILSLTFDLAAPATEGTEYTVNIACTDLKDANDNSLEGSTVIKKAHVVAKAKYTVGDLNGDNKYDIADVILILKIIAKWDLPDVFIVAADVNGDGCVNTMDATYYLKAIAGWKGFSVGTLVN